MCNVFVQMEETFNIPFRSDTRSSISDDAATVPATSMLRSSNGILSVAFGDPWCIHFDFVPFLGPPLSRYSSGVEKRYDCVLHVLLSLLNVVEMARALR